jgi:hypothetical protein
VEHFYPEKSTTKDLALRSMYKSFLNKNNLLGRFGLKLERTITKIYPKADEAMILVTSHPREGAEGRDIKNYKEINEDNVLITHGTEINKKITESFGLDYFKVLNKVGESEVSLNTFKNVSIPISAAVTAYARIYMHKITKTEYKYKDAPPNWVTGLVDGEGSFSLIMTRSKAYKTG